MPKELLPRVPNALSLRHKNKISKVKSRPKREDGIETKEKLLRCAGEIIALKGFDRTTSKEICERAAVNTAAVNYHFGSRDNLYRELLIRIHQSFLTVDTLKELLENKLTSRKRLEKIFDALIPALLNKEAWLLRVWLREISNPTPFLSEIAQSVGKEKITLIKKLFSDYTKRPINDPALYACMLAFIAPLAFIFIGHNNSVDYQRLTEYPKTSEEFFSDIRVFIFAGVDAFKV